MSEYPGEQLRQLHVRPPVVVVIAVDCGDVWTWIEIGGFLGLTSMTSPPPPRAPPFLFCGRLLHSFDMALPRLTLRHLESLIDVHISSTSPLPLIFPPIVVHQHRPPPLSDVIGHDAPANDAVLGQSPPPPPRSSKLMEVMGCLDATACSQPPQTPDPPFTLQAGQGEKICEPLK